MKMTAVITIGIVVTVSKPTDVLELQETGKRSIGIRQSLFNVSAARCIQSLKNFFPLEIFVFLARALARVGVGVGAVVGVGTGVAADVALGAVVGVAAGVAASSTRRR